VGWGALALAFAASTAAQTTIRVPLDYPTIQLGINAAADGDTVLVAPGTYVENINFLGKAITVTSEGGPEVTFVDGNDVEPVVKFRSGERRDSVLSGLTLLNGRSTSATFGEGGGIWVWGASPTITGNIIAKNRACSGAGIGVDLGSSPLIQRNTIINNRHDFCSGGGGGGIFVSPGAATPRPPPVEILDNVISGNDARFDRGGGIMTHGNTLIRGNLITDNFTADHNCAGGGIYARSDVTIVHNVVARNRAHCGAGVYLDSTPVGYVVAHNTIVDNDAPPRSGLPGVGSGIYYHSGAGAGGVVPRPRGNLIVAKSGQNAVYCGPSTVLPVFEYNNVFAPAGTAYGGSCNAQPGATNISADPLFLDQVAGNFHLQPGSPSLDISGDLVPAFDISGSLVPFLPARDADGNARLMDGDDNGTLLLDHGAYERAAFLTPQSHEFGRKDLGSAPVSQTFSLVNSSASTLTISSVSMGSRVVGAGGYSDFAVGLGGPEPCSSLNPILSAGQSCTVVVTFTPSAIPGRKGATLRVVSDAPGSPHVASLSAAIVIDSSIA